MVYLPLVNASIVTQWLLLPVSDEYELSVKIVRGLGDSLLVAAAAPRSLGAGHEEECGEGRQPGHQHRDQDRRAASTDPEHLISPAFNVGRMSLFQETNVFNHKEAKFLPFDLMIISRSVSSSIHLKWLDTMTVQYARRMQSTPAHIHLHIHQDVFCGNFRL